MPAWMSVASVTSQSSVTQPPPIPIQVDEYSASPARRCVTVGTIQSAVMAWNSVPSFSSAPWTYPAQLYDWFAATATIACAYVGRPTGASSARSSGARAKTRGTRARAAEPMPVRLRTGAGAASFRGSRNIAKRGCTPWPLAQCVPAAPSRNVVRGQRDALARSIRDELRRDREILAAVGVPAAPSTAAPRHGEAERPDRPPVVALGAGRSRIDPHVLPHAEALRHRRAPAEVMCVSLDRDVAVVRRQGRRHWSAQPGLRFTVAHDTQRVVRDAIGASVSGIRSQQGRADIGPHRPRRRRFGLARRQREDLRPLIRRLLRAHRR